MSVTFPPRNRPLLALTAVAIAALFVLVLASPRESQNRALAAQATAAASPVKFNADGQLLQPTGYREWIYVGTPLTPNDMNRGKAPFPEFHAVYIDPASYAQVKKTGEFADGTVLVKELVSVGSKAASSGRGYFMGDFIGLEVAMKDEQRFPEEPGNWAYFSFGHKYPLAKMAKAQKTANCNECHENNADEDYVFTQYYPVLRAAAEAAEAAGP